MIIMLISTTTITDTIVMRQEMNKVLAFFCFYYPHVP